MARKYNLFYHLILSILFLTLLSACSTAGAETVSDAVPSYSDQLLGAVMSPPRSLSDFTMDSTTGEAFKLSDYRGKVILLYFGYRSCPDFCPTTFSELRRVYQELGSPEEVQVVFVTVDPERDTMDYLALYTQAFHEDFIGLRDEGAALARMMDEFGVVANRRQLGDSALSYLIDHTASVFLIGPDSRLQVQYLYGTDYRDILHDVKIILNEA